MSILIHDMEMPTSCDKCRFCVNGFTDDAPMYECAVQSYENVSVLVESGGKPFDFRPDWCPLIELPPHGNLKDESDIISLIEVMFCKDKDGMEHAIQCVKDAPTVIEAEGSES